MQGGVGAPEDALAQLLAGLGLEGGLLVGGTRDTAGQEVEAKQLGVEGVERLGARRHGDAHPKLRLRVEIGSDGDEVRRRRQVPRLGLRLRLEMERQQFLELGRRHPIRLQSHTPPPRENHAADQLTNQPDSAPTRTDTAH